MARSILGALGRSLGGAMTSAAGPASVTGALGAGLSAAASAPRGGIMSALGGVASSYGRGIRGALGTVGTAGLGALGTTAGAMGLMGDRAVSLPAMNLGAYGGGGGYYGGGGLPPAQPDPTQPGGGGGISRGGAGLLQGAGASFQPYDMSKMVSSYNQAFAEAKAANERRYQQMLGITAKTTGQRGIDIRGDYAQREAAAMQQLARLGMSGTTIAPTLGMGFEREQSAALDRLADEMQGTKLGIIERRQDPYPSLASLVSMGQLGPTTKGLEKLQF